MCIMYAISISVVEELKKQQWEKLYKLLLVSILVIKFQRLSFLLCEQENDCLIWFAYNRTGVFATYCYNEIRASVSQANLEAVIHMDSLQTLRTSLQRWRRGVVPQSPQNYNSIPSMETFPQRYTRNKLDDDVFLFLDRTYIPPEGDNGTAYRLLAFMSPRSATELVNADKVLVDGTFKVAANPFAQLFTISTFRGGDPDKIQMIPRCWALLPFKSEHLYTYFFTELFSELSNRFGLPMNTIRWRELSSDFESGLLPFYRNYLIPTLQQARNDNDEQKLRIKGCLFHFAQALHRKLVDLGLLQDYMDITKPLKKNYQIIDRSSFPSCGPSYSYISCYRIHRKILVPPGGTNNYPQGTNNYPMGYL